MEIKPIKILETELNNFKELEKSLENLPNILEANTKKVETFKLAFENLSETDREIIQKTCIEGKKPIELEEYFNFTERMIYYKKEAALKRLFLMIYGINLFESEGK